MRPVFTILPVLLACSTSHVDCAEHDSGRVVDAGVPMPEIVEGAPIPWDDVQIRFLGVTDLAEPGGDDVELRWQIDHGGERPYASPVFHHQRSVPPDIAEINITPMATGAEIRLRMAYAGSFIAGANVGLRISRPIGSSGDVESWDVPQRWVQMRTGGSAEPRLATYDGRLELELIADPSIAHDAGAWIVQAGVPYRVTYRLHNRTDATVTAELTITPGDTIVEGALEETMTLAPRASLDFSRVVTVPAPGSCFDCFRLAGSVAGEETAIDAFIHFAYAIE